MNLKMSRNVALYAGLILPVLETVRRIQWVGNAPGFELPGRKFKAIQKPSDATVIFHALPGKFQYLETSLSFFPLQAFLPPIPVLSGMS